MSGDGFRNKTYCIEIRPTTDSFHNIFFRRGTWFGLSQPLCYVMYDRITEAYFQHSISIDLVYQSSGGRHLQDAVPSPRLTYTNRALLLITVWAHIPTPWRQLERIVCESCLLPFSAIQWKLMKIWRVALHGSLPALCGIISRYSDRLFS